MTLPLSAPAELAADLGAVDRYLVVLDFDGTLAPIVDRPEDARPAPGSVAVLRRVAAATPVAVLSGRPVDQLQELLGDLPVTFAGGHGAEILHPRDGHHALVDVDEVTEVLDAAQRSVEQVVADGAGWFVERKATSLAVHHRLVPEDAEAALLPRVLALLDAQRDEGPSFEVITGKAVVELRPAGVDKGTALSWLLTRHAGLLPLVVGDDRTDEDAFVVATELGGVAVLVGVDARPTAASARLAAPSDVVELLTHLTGSTEDR